MRVIFKKFSEGDVIALFPDEVFDPHGNIMSYQKIGQHGPASPQLIYELNDAKSKEYQSLLNELKNLSTSKPLCPYRR